MRCETTVRSGQVRRGRINALCMLVESLKNRLRKSSNAVELTKSIVHGTSICSARKNAWGYGFVALFVARGQTLKP